MARLLSKRTGEKRPKMGEGLNIMDPEFLSQQSMLMQVEQQAVSARQKQKKQVEQKYIRWVKFGVVLWAIRASVLGLGVSVGGLHVLFEGVLNWAGMNSYASVPSWTYSDALEKLPASNIRARGLPFLLTGVPLAGVNRINEVLSKTKFNAAKYSDKSDVFTYVMDSRSWKMECAMDKSVAPKKSQTRAVHKIGSFPYTTSSSSSADSSSSGHWYLSQPMPGSLNNPLINAIASHFVDFVGGLSRSTQTSIWLSSADVSVPPHYDTDDNFYLQVKGQKRFIITDPSAHELFASHSFLHPEWRQARHHLTSPGALQESYSEITRLRRTAVVQRRSGKKTQSSDIGVPALTSFPHSWEVTLNPGDVLFLPAYYFHSVNTVGSGSLSFNVWIPSVGSDAALQLSTGRLPFIDNDLGSPILGLNGNLIASKESRMRLKLRCLARMASMAYATTRTVNPIKDLHKKRTSEELASAKLELRAMMLSRHSLRFDFPHGRGSNVRGCPTHIDTELAPICSNEDKEGDISNASLLAIDEAADRAIRILSKIKASAVRATLFMDYVDELFSIIATESGHNSPHAMQTFVKDCL